jgi:hypothetical protein
MKTSDLYVASFIQLTTKQTPILKLDSNKRIFFLFSEMSEDQGQRFYADCPVPVSSFVATLKQLKSRMFETKEQMGGFGK